MRVYSVHSGICFLLNTLLMQKITERIFDAKFFTKRILYTIHFRCIRLSQTLKLDPIFFVFVFSRISLTLS